MDKRYLLQRKRAWNVGYAIPSRAQQFIGKSEFAVSLKTRSIEEAKIRKLYYLQEFSKEIQSALKFDAINPKESYFRKMKTDYFMPSISLQR